MEIAKNTSTEKHKEAVRKGGKGKGRKRRGAEKLAGGGHAMLHGMGVAIML